MKVAIITLYGNTNFGNKLQNYALQNTLEKFNFEVKTLNNISKISKDKIFNKKLIFLRKIYRNLKNINFGVTKLKREQKIKQFSKKYINLDKKVITSKNSKQFSKKYDLFIYGSDQIWNPYINQPFNVCLGTFANKNQNIAYAPSLSVDSLPNECIQIYKEAFLNFKCLSCREDSGVEIIKNLTNRECNLVLDPVFLLEKDEWLKKFRINERPIEKKYILLYFIDSLDLNVKKIIDSKFSDYEIVNLLDKKNKETYIIDPIQFLAYIYNAELIITDSFHATSFSIIFNKSFWVLNRSKNLKMF